MSFAKNSKEELARLEINNECCAKAELAAFIFINGRLNLGENIYLELSSENAAIIRKMFTLLKETFRIEAQVLVRQKNRLKKNKVFILRVDTHRYEVLKILTSIGILKDDGVNLVFKEEIAKDFYFRDCCSRAFLRGAYLASGSVSNPDSSYHLEILSEYQNKAEDLVDIMKRFELNPGMMEKKNGSYIIYLKGSDEISTLLNIVGAHKALLDFENIRVIKEMRNKINRLVNCETANLQKTVVASLRQIENIDIVDRKIGVYNLPPDLKEMAVKRVNHPEKNLKELGAVMDPPIGKSGVNHRLRKLEKMAKNLRNE